MKITSLRIRMLNNTGNKMKGVVSITLDNMIVIHDIKILENNNELFLAMPSKTIKPGTFKDSVHPINSLVRNAIERIVFATYELCSECNYGTAQFDINPSFGESLLEQTFSDFQLVSNEKYNISNDFFGDSDNKSTETIDSNKKGNAFLDWLNN